MLFSSYEFILLFLPICLAGYFLLAKREYIRTSLTWLVLCSLFYYSWWNYIYLWLMISSIVFNYFWGMLLSRKQKNHLFLIIGIACNLFLLGYFKYSNFFIENINALFGLGFNEKNIILPLAISFFTFQQIAYLVDAYRNETHEYDFLQYTLFVTFFPQLIAGPIVHHKEMLPQFTVDLANRINAKNLLLGISVFSMGLAKKILIADHIAKYANPVFSAADMGIMISFIEAWQAALAYTFQLYFDFSGYADMAVGIALMFGIRLPMNFNSPYKPANIIEFWRRWHMTLSRFLRDYLYIPLGGNRHGSFSRHRNIFITMLLGGLWHGASWSFILWGALHGIYLIINHGWHFICKRNSWQELRNKYWYRFFAIALTFLAVMLAWVFFRAETLSGAVNILSGMAGLQGIEFPIEYLKEWENLGPFMQDMGVVFTDVLFKNLDSAWKLTALLLVVFILPNSLEIMSKYHITTDYSRETTSRILFKPSLAWALFVYLLLSTCILKLGRASDFLYFQF